jgi:hypothetical protein
MALPKAQDLDAFIGVDNLITMTMKPVENITGWSLQFLVLQEPHSTTALITKGIGTGITITSGPGGVATVLIASANTEDMPAGLYHYALRRIDVGARDVLAYGSYQLHHPSAA